MRPAYHFSAQKPALALHFTQSQSYHEGAEALPSSPHCLSDHRAVEKKVDKGIGKANREQEGRVWEPGELWERVSPNTGGKEDLRVPKGCQWSLPPKIPGPGRAAG